MEEKKKTIVISINIVLLFGGSQFLLINKRRMVSLSPLKLSFVLLQFCFFFFLFLFFFFKNSFFVLFLFFYSFFSFFLFSAFSHPTPFFSLSLPFTSHPPPFSPTPSPHTKKNLFPFSQLISAPGGSDASPLSLPSFSESKCVQVYGSPIAASFVGFFILLLFFFSFSLFFFYYFSFYSFYLLPPLFSLFSYFFFSWSGCTHERSCAKENDSSTNSSHFGLF